MRIIHITDFASNNWSGISDVLFNLVKNQREIGHIVEIVNQNKQESKSRINDLLLLSFESNLDFCHFIEKFNPTVVIFHSFYKIRYIKYYKILNDLSVPFLIQPHGAFSEFNQKKSGFKKKLANIFLYKRFISKSAGILYLNVEEKETSVFNKLNVNSIIPNGVNSPETFKLDIDNKYLNVIYLSRIDIHHKGIDLLLAALRLCEKKLINTNFKLTFYGSGKSEDIEFLKSQVNQTKLNIEIKDAVYNTEKSQVLENADILVLTSRYEGMPITILEALSFGIPCLITPETNFSKLILSYNCGWITSSSPSEIAETLILAVKEYQKNKLALRQNARNAIVGNYEWNMIANNSILIYQKMISLKQNTIKPLTQI